MLRSCSRCGRIHAPGDCLAPRQSNSKRTREQRFRSTAAWQRLANHVRDRDDNLCQACLRETPAMYTTQGLSVHHIEKLQTNYDLRLDAANCITLCAYHHERAESGQIPQADLKAWAEESRRSSNPDGRASASEHIPPCVSGGKGNFT